MYSLEINEERVEVIFNDARDAREWVQWLVAYNGADPQLLDNPDVTHVLIGWPAPKPNRG